MKSALLAVIPMIQHWCHDDDIVGAVRVGAQGGAGTITLFKLNSIQSTGILGFIHIHSVCFV